MKYAVAGSLWDRVWTLEVDARSENGVENANNVFECLPHMNWPQDEHKIRKLFGLAKRASFFNPNNHLWSILSSSPRSVQILCTAWLSTIEDAAYRRSVEATLLTTLVFSDALALFKPHKDVALDMVLWLVEEYGVDKNAVQELFQGPDCAAALQCAMENDRIPIMAFLHRCGTPIRPQDVFQYGGVLAMEYFMEKVDPAFVVTDELLIAMSSKPTKVAVLQYVHKLWSKSTLRDLDKVESLCLHAAALNGQGRLVQYFAKSYEQTHSASEFESFLIQHVDAFYQAYDVMSRFVDDMEFDLTIDFDIFVLFDVTWQRYLIQLLHQPNVRIKQEIVQWLEEFSPDDYQVEVTMPRPLH